MSRPPLLERLGSSLRARLTAAFAAVIFVSVALAGTGFALILRDYQTRTEVNQVAELTQPLANQVRSLGQLGAGQEQIAELLQTQADELGLRLVLTDNRGLVLVDTDGRLVGQQLDLRGEPRFSLPRRVRQGTLQGPSGELTFLLASAAPSQQSGGQRPAPGGPALVGAAVPERGIAAAWLELLPQLGLAALLALAVSVAIAWALAASIARRLAEMTRAAEAIARGRYDQRIEVGGRDEVARLARAFNRMAQEVSSSQRTMRDFLANVSHDLRTPLTSIQGFSQALTDGTLTEPSEVAEAGRIVNLEAGRMHRLIEDLTLLSRMESGQAPLEQRELALAPLVVGRLRAAAPRAVEAKLALDWRPAASPRVLGDASRLERVVDNLLDNALRHAPAGGRVEVRLALTPDGEWARLTVHNTGSFIPTDDLERIFERFYQRDRSRTSGGSGLGLAISREIAQAHGGRCWAESSPDGGTTFYLELPTLAPPRAGGDQATRMGGAAAEAEPVVPLGSANQAQD